MGPEKKFEVRIKEYLKEKDCWHVKYFANQFTKSGIPDILACVGGYFVAIEVKASSGRPSALQKHQQSVIRCSGGISIILYPDQFEQFKSYVDDLLNDRAMWHDQYKFDKR